MNCIAPHAKHCPAAMRRYVVVVVLGLALTGCGGDPAPVPVTPAPAATTAPVATQPEAPVGPPRHGWSADSDMAPRWLGYAHFQQRKAENPVLRNMTDDELLEQADAICRRIDNGIMLPPIIEEFVRAGVKHDEASEFVSSAYLAFCPLDGS